MIEFMMGVFVGYIVGKVSSILANALRPIDKILMWDNSILGYRPVQRDHKVKPSETYLICYEVSANDTQNSSS